MTTPRTCPDCNQGLKADATSCRCGWTLPTARTEAAEEGHRLKCENGDGETAMVRENGKNICLRCYEGAHNSESFERCKAMGLTSVEEMKDYCRKSMRELFRKKHDGNAWLENLKQRTVDLIVQMDTEADRKVLERARRLCVIDSKNKVIPKEDRPAKRAVLSARIQEERRRAEAMLKAQRETAEAMDNGTGA